jgi:hypothetical protein
VELQEDKGKKARRLSRLRGMTKTGSEMPAMILIPGLISGNCCSGENLFHEV